MQRLPAIISVQGGGWVVTRVETGGIEIVENLSNKKIENWHNWKERFLNKNEQMHKMKI